MMRIGHGYDVHAFDQSRPLIIGGLEIPHDRGLKGHSDADVLLHTITDAILGALALGDIGKFFPDTDAKYKDADSKLLLSEVVDMMHSKGYEIGNIDAVVLAERPKFRPYIDQMRESVASLLKTDLANVNIKATTSEKLGFIGREEGIASEAVVLLNKQEVN
ncbi:2-C-methyl-D-erythritol 2,4-cyclodiphosphate synthase [Jeotgalicoccus meleagridis]|uniref:2-C-methyl-D-erythritol 2,4-cyclodiphosphate synthase n=1 Tax=Jeotgalicoccus meleagridis TaxID=2759181 RepID=A0A6V7RA47_9STAP|nr:2-C-methyl-D-erythritol 2,4-cyclodiphosphate synthase [Jeotgalicoccus meleagridis]CAD2074428.1 2-C-methyl-D-erythritol 2,4-cyclodiphosphate synthase [Jeotgalicoccus meleagridis]HIW39295.1 2-C-methyl-D-erythritol 2,4-cyclodiphosphate synthase [Candidatus Jeotgalicoccus stercoravium]